MTVARLGLLTLPSSRDRWESLSLIGPAGGCFFGDVSVDFAPCGDAPFRLGIDVASPPQSPAPGLPAGMDLRPVSAGHDLDTPTDRAVVAVDHVVILTDDLDRTAAAFTDALDAPRRRIRDAGGGRRQGFHLLANTLLEVVESPEHPAGVHVLWGLALSVADIDAVCVRAGGLVSEPKEAVQAGRRIATVRESAGLGVHVALMTPRPGRATAAPAG